MSNASRDFQGVLYDIISEQVIERSPVVRGSYAQAMADAKALVPVVNQMAEESNDEAGSDSTIGRVDDSYCFVLVDGEVAYGEAA